MRDTLRPARARPIGARRPADVFRLVLAAILASGLLAAAVPAAAQVNPFGKGRAAGKLTATDLDLFQSSVSRLNRNPNSANGAEEDWANPATGNRGRSAITRVHTSGGRRCHDVSHAFSIVGEVAPSTYRLTWCQVSNGEWKIKS